MRGCGFGILAPSNKGCARVWLTGPPVKDVGGRMGSVYGWTYKATGRARRALSGTETADYATRATPTKR